MSKRWQKDTIVDLDGIINSLDDIIAKLENNDPNITTEKYTLTSSLDAIKRARGRLNRRWDDNKSPIT